MGGGCLGQKWGTFLFLFLFPVSVSNPFEVIFQALSGVINHVKLLVIDSKVFAEEVEPTGAVPMELSLER